MNCEICEKKRMNRDGTPGGADCPGVCDTCRRHAEIGKRVEGMKLLEAGDMDDDQPRGRTEGYMDGWNDCLEEAKGEKP